MSSLMFCVPAHGRVRLAQICLKQLRHTCDQLTAHGIAASAVVVADDDNLVTARALGFGTVVRDNKFVSRRFNDAIQAAFDPRHNPHPADYCVPLGSDDWVDWRIFTKLPARDTVLGFQRIAFVREDGLELTTRFLNYPGGCGIRVYPRQVIEQLGFRPGDEDRARGCDTSILYNLQRTIPNLRIEHRDIDPRQIVDWKSPGAQLNPYESLRRHRLELTGDPFDELAGLYPDVALDEMAAHYGRVGEPVAA